MREVALEPRAVARTDQRWLALLCLGRMSFGLIFMACAGSLSMLMNDWNMSAGQGGIIQGGWHVGYLLSLLFAGFLSDRFGAKRTFQWGSVAACVSAWAFAVWSQGFISCLLLFSLTGLCSGGSYTPGLTLIAQRFAPNKRGAAMGWYLAASTLGYSIALLVSSRLIGEWGWRATFFAAASGPLLGTLISSYTLRQTPNIVSDRRPGIGTLRALAAVWRNKQAMLVIWSYAFHSWELLCLWAWLPAYLTAAAIQAGAPDAMTLGLWLAALTFAVNAFGTVSAGALSDRMPRTIVMLVLTLTSLACSFVFGWLFTAPLWLLTCVAMVYNLSALGDSPIYSLALTELVPARYLGTAYSLRSVLGFGLGAISPALFGLVLDGASGVTGERGTFAWGIAWSFLGLGALAGPFFIARLHVLRHPRLRNADPH